MGAIDTVKAGLAAVEQGDFKKVEEFAADDLVFAGPTPQPLGKREFLATQMALHTAFPGLALQRHGLHRSRGRSDRKRPDHWNACRRTEPARARFRSRCPPPGKRISLPVQKTSWTLKNGKLSRLDADPSPASWCARYTGSTWDQHAGLMRSE